jgi:hypothetical protein
VREKPEACLGSNLIADRDGLASLGELFFQVTDQQSKPFLGERIEVIPGHPPGLLQPPLEFIAIVASGHRDTPFYKYEGAAQLFNPNYIFGL